MRIFRHSSCCSPLPRSRRAAGAATHAYTNGQLALMVLPKSQLGPTGRGLEVKIGSGVQSNAAAAEDTLDPKDTGPQLGRGGRISGYSLEYDELAFQGLKRGSGMLAVGTSVDLFTSAAAADALHARSSSRTARGTAASTSRPDSV